MGSGSFIGKIASVAGPALMAVNPVAGMAVMGVGALVGSAEERKNAKNAQNAAAQANAEAQSQYEKNAARSAELYQAEITRSQEATAMIQQNLDDVNKRIDGAKAAGDTIAAESLTKQQQMLSDRLTEEKRIAKQSYDTGMSKLQELETQAKKYYGEDLAKSSAMREQFRQQNAAALGVETSNRAYEDKLTKQVSEQAAQEAGLESGTPRGLAAAESEQDSRFEAMRREAERGAVARGEDPRRAALAVEMEQARAGGKLSADYRKNRINELMSIAQGTKLSSGATAANIAAQGLQLGTPTEGRQMAQYLDAQGMRQYEAQQGYGAGELSRYSAGAEAGSRLAADYDAGRASRIGAAAEAKNAASNSALGSRLGVLGGLRAAQTSAVTEQNAAGANVAGMYTESARGNLQAAADAKAAQSKMWEGVAQAGAGVAAGSWGKGLTQIKSKLPKFTPKPTTPPGQTPFVMPEY